MDYLTLGGKCLIGIILGVLLGNGAVYIFNKIPGKWLVDYGETPTEELLNPTHQRVKSTPWKYLLTALFVIIGIKLFITDILYAIPSLLVLWFMVLISMSDIKYKIVPDQLIYFLIITGIGMVSYHDLGALDIVYGGLLGFGLLFLAAFISKLLHKDAKIGGGDIKLFGALGLVTGLDGIISIMILTALLSGIHMGFLLLTKKISLKSEMAMVPYIAVATGIYLLFIQQLVYGKNPYLVL